MSQSTDTPYGFILAGRIGGGGPIEAYKRKYPVDSANGTAIASGHVMKAEADGNVAPAAAGDSDILGVAIECETSSNVPTEYLAASTAGSVTICIDPKAIYRVQANGAITETDRFHNTDHVVNSGVDTNLGKSTHGLDANTQTATALFRILDKADIPGNTWDVSYPEMFVTPNEHHLIGATGI